MHVGWRFSLCFYIQGIRGSPQSAGVPFLNGRMISGTNEMRQVEAKYPALLFKQQLTAFVEKIYGMLRDNLKKEISPLLGLCIQVHSLLKEFNIFGCLKPKTLNPSPYPWTFLARASTRYPLPAEFSVVHSVSHKALILNHFH